jgi:predicted kinase
MPTAHLVFGHVGAGKTTLARALEARHRAVRFSHDEWMVSLFGQDPDAARFPEWSARVHDLIDGLWPRCLELGLDVVLDLAFWTRAQRDAARARAASLGAVARLYHVACDPEAAWARVSRRNAEPGALQITRPTFDLLRARVEPLGPDEPREVVETAPARPPPS